MGMRALNLGWQNDRVRGIHNPAKVGRRAFKGRFCRLLVTSGTLHAVVT